MDAVILAGGKITPKDLLWSESKGLPKALIDINGKPMIQWVIDAANDTKSINRILIFGLDKIDVLKSQKPLHHFTDQGGILENLAAAARIIRNESPDTSCFLSISADIPLITAEIIESVIHTSLKPGNDLNYNIIEKEVMQSKFPGVKRTYIKFGDGRFCGGDMHLFNPGSFVNDAAKKLVKYRKSPLKLIMLFGLKSLIKMIFFRLTIEKGLEIIKKQTGISCCAVKCKWAELGMDVDTPRHLEMVREYLSKKTNR